MNCVHSRNGYLQLWDFMVNIIKLFSHSSTLIKVVALLKSKPGVLCLSSGIWGQLPSKQYTEMNKELAIFIVRPAIKTLASL